ncbi:leucyl aminopeptidase [Agrococcus sp. SGAir0287]|uniref:leucyl aminopeptidase n=1 Tax=Agrococcus sp. SGAir0287 TaxID=2070347 RepID=UPI0010CD58AD|nr:leucyl aminopeptidase [Agrococcus sp. SGAir0287]QCR19377.1 leucyl aminopeptidase [Agrococcus sp. SGAir0287]
MPIPALSLIAAADDATADVLVRGVLAGDSPAAADVDADLLLAIGATGKVGSVVRAVVDGRAVAFVGLGTRATTRSLRDAAATATRALAGTPSVAIALPVQDADDVAAVLEGAALGAYRFDRYKADDASSTPPAEVAVVVGDVHVTDAVVRRARIVAEAVARTRDLANTPPRDLSPAIFADLVRDEAEATGLRVTVRDEVALASEGFGGLVGVGQGSSRPPRLVTVEWAPAGAERHVALVGKGITYDTGGLSLKPAASMQHMKFDMTGAATVYAVTAAAAALQLPVRVTAYLCLAENMPSGTAIRPDDVLTIRGGRTVEVTNTDAEGRLVMADAIALASETDADAIIDVATLTGAQVIALGDRVSGLMGNDDDLVATIRAAHDAADEDIWPMPLPDDLLAVLDSPVADIANAKVGNRSAGMLLAGVFLSTFVGERDGSPIPWAHLDIAGPAMNTGSPRGTAPTGATGVVVRGLIGSLTALSRATQEPDASR